MSSSNAKTLSIFMPAIILYPNTQAKAQFELDIVIGKGVLPPSRTWMKISLFGGIGKKKWLRWNSAAPICIPCWLIEEGTYKGYILHLLYLILGMPTFSWGKLLVLMDDGKAGCSCTTATLSRSACLQTWTIPYQQGDIQPHSLWS